MNRVRIKICGITRVEDALAAAAAGADAVGLVFFAGSKRCVDAARAREIVAALPPFVSAVGLFVNAGADEVRRVLDSVPLDLLQFHGDEDAAYCRRFGRPYLKAVRVRSADDICRAQAAYPDARALLLDAYVEGEYGGTGRSFDWSLRLPPAVRRRWTFPAGWKRRRALKTRQKSPHSPRPSAKQPESGRQPENAQTAFQAALNDRQRKKQETIGSTRCGRN